MKSKSEKQIIFGVVKVGSKGQIAIPIDLRKYLDINEGDQLVVARRRDNKGITLIKMGEMEKLMEFGVLSNGEAFE